MAIPTFRPTSSCCLEDPHSKVDWDPDFAALEGEEMGTKMYETQDKQMPGSKYPIQALHVDGKQVDKPDCDFEMDNFDGGDDKFVKKTKSAGRRKRRALIGQVLC